MSLVKELDLCPHCMEKIYREIAKCQNQLKEGQKDNKDKVTEGQKEGRPEEKEEKKEEKQEKCAKDGGHQIASKEEVDKCLSSLPYIVPICDYCKAHRKISILKLPATSCIIQKPEEIQKTADK